MSDDPKPAFDPRAVRSRFAKALLDDPILNEVLKSMTDRATGEWINSPPDKPDVRELAWHRVRAVQAVKAEIEFIATDFAVRNFNTKTKI